MLATASKVNFGDDRPLWIWSAALGFASGPGQDRGILDPVEALAFVIHAETDAICLMKDVPALFATNPALVRGLGDAYDAVSLRAGAVVLAYPSIDISSDLRKEVNLLELALPDALELYGLLKALNDAYAETERVSDEWLERVSYATQGLSSNETRDLSNLVDPRFHFSGMDAINESLIMGWTTEYSNLVSPTHELKYVEVSA